MLCHPKSVARRYLKSKIDTDIAGICKPLAKLVTRLWCTCKWLAQKFTKQTLCSMPFRYCTQPNDCLGCFLVASGAGAIVGLICCLAIQEARHTESSSRPTLPSRQGKTKAETSPSPAADDFCRTHRRPT